MPVGRMLVRADKVAACSYFRFGWLRSVLWDAR